MTFNDTNISYVFTTTVSVPLCVDVSVQFSWVDVKTGRLLVYSTSMRYTSVIV